MAQDTHIDNFETSFRFWIDQKDKVLMYIHHSCGNLQAWSKNLTNKHFCHFSFKLGPHFEILGWIFSTQLFINTDFATLTVFFCKIRKAGMYPARFSHYGLTKKTAWTFSLFKKNIYYSRLKMATKSNIDRSIETVHLFYKVIKLLSYHVLLLLLTYLIWDFRKLLCPNNLWIRKRKVW